jgi:hypothetical protein
MSYAGKHGTDGFIPREAVTRINARNVDMGRLVSAGLLKTIAGGWDICSWDEYQITDDESHKRRSKAQHAAAVRWSKAEVKKESGHVRAMH